MAAEFQNPLPSTILLKRDNSSRSNSVRMEFQGTVRMVYCSAWPCANSAIKCTAICIQHLFLPSIRKAPLTQTAKSKHVREVADFDFVFTSRTILSF